MSCCLKAIFVLSLVALFVCSLVRVGFRPNCDSLPSLPYRETKDKSGDFGFPGFLGTQRRENKLWNKTWGVEMGPGVGGELRGRGIYQDRTRRDEGGNETMIYLLSWSLVCPRVGMSLALPLPWPDGSHLSLEPEPEPEPGGGNRGRNLSCASCVLHNGYRLGFGFAACWVKDGS